ncbi:hypothetical protein RFI_20937 [Reticulomyxa filosa]|uniref:Uncharacterized protein n=1 Tax=Reticulomyxa filosa TaxID=46433 RepID=X6MRZ2_RETFI|nr:hypothetical protein RFI_20937 [Reticulomyxa filosa]|eukprot:ETO16401.1 hypothetical protein RFI_20937 [Reticulomyxa filosa]
MICYRDVTAKARKECKEKEEKIAKMEEQMSTLKGSNNSEMLKLQKDLVSAQTKLATQQLEMEEMTKEKTKNASKIEEYANEIKELQKRLNESMQIFQKAQLSSTNALTNSNQNEASIHPRDANSSDSEWKKRLEEVQLRHHLELQRLQKGYELEITALSVEIRRLKGNKADTYKLGTPLQGQSHQSMTDKTDGLRELAQETNEQWISYKAIVENEIAVLKQLRFVMFHTYLYSDQFDSIIFFIF